MVGCEHAAVPLDRAIFAPLEGYAPTVVLAPAGLRAEFAALEAGAEGAYVGAAGDTTLDLELALGVLRERGIASVLCEGGPTLAGRLVEGGLVDRIDWLVAPVLLRGPDAVPALGTNAVRTLRFDRVERLGPDVLLSAKTEGNTCSAD